MRNRKTKWFITTTGNTISFRNGSGNRQIESGYSKTTKREEHIIVGNATKATSDI